MGLDTSHALDVVANANAPWWGLFGLVVIICFFVRGPAVIRAFNEFLKTQRELGHRHKQNMTKLGNGAQQRLPKNRTPKKRDGE